MKSRSALLAQRLVLPHEIAGLSVRLEADSGIAVADDAGLDTWGGMSGTGIDATQVDAGFQPIYHADDGDGKPCVEFDGVDNRMLTGAVTLGPSFTWFVLVKVLGGAFPQGIVNRDPGSSNNRLGRIRAQAATFESLGYTQAGGVITGTHTDSMAAVVANWNIVTMVRRSPSNIETFVNGVSDGATGAGADGTTVTAGLVIGAGTSVPANFAAMKLRAFLAYGTNLGVSDRKNVERYLSRHFPSAPSVP